MIVNYSTLISKSFYKFVGMHWFVTALSVLMTILLYPQLPAQVPIHFDIAGGADSFGPKLNVIGLPLALVILGLMMSSRWIDRQYADLTLVNVLLKTMLLVLMVVVWYGIGTVYFAYW